MDWSACHPCHPAFTVAGHANAKPADLKDPWMHPVQYKLPGEGRAFDLVSLGADGQPGGDSVNADIRYE